MFQATTLHRAAAVAVGGIVFVCSAQTSHAASLAVELACASDYYAHCSQYDSDSPQVRTCMRANGLKLSRICVKALASAGEMTPADEQAYAKATKK